MKTLKPINIEYLRRITTLILLSFFTSKELPLGFQSAIVSNNADFLSVQDDKGERYYFSFSPVERQFSLGYAPKSIQYPIRNYAYLLMIFVLLVYILIPKAKIPEGAAYYTKFNAVYLPDALGAFLWTGVWMFFFVPDDSAPVSVRYFFLLIFGLFAFIIAWSANKYASSWYRFKGDSFEWSDMGGKDQVGLSDIVSVKPYKRQLPKWLAPLIILFGRGQPGATGIGILSGTSAPEIGMEITTKSGQKIKVMANYLERDDAFTESFQKLEKKLEGRSND